MLLERSIFEKLMVEVTGVGCLFVNAITMALVLVVTNILQSRNSKCVSTIADVPKLGCFIECMYNCWLFLVVVCWLLIWLDI